MPENDTNRIRNLAGLPPLSETGFTTQNKTVLTIPHRTHRHYKPRARKCKRPGCNVTFTPLARHGKYCSDICRKRDHRRRARKKAKAHKSEPVLELRVCDHCGNTFLAAKGRGARYCSDSHKSLAYRSRRKAAIRALMGDMDVSERMIADELEISGMTLATRYLTGQGYSYDSFTRAWVIGGVQGEVRISA